MQAIIISDLGYGDSGKGLLTDYLTHKYNAPTVIRYNGGSQAAHNVITPEGVHHTFSQFGSGTFAGADTYLSRYMIVNPMALIEEGNQLFDLGIRDIFSRIYVDANALVTTPYHIAANRIKESARSKRHGSCGKGIGETVAEYIQHPCRSLHVGDLWYTSSVRGILALQRAGKKSEIASMRDSAAPEDIAVFDDDSLLDEYVDGYKSFCEAVQIVEESTYLPSLLDHGTVIFEGAQGILLDECYGFYPHTTWTNTTTANARKLLNDYRGKIESIGVIRSYATRHGAGPFVTEATELARLLPDIYNPTNPWQGDFRVGYFDAVATRYALEVVGGIDSLAVTHIDEVSKFPYKKVCWNYTSASTKWAKYFSYLDMIPDLSGDYLTRQEHLGHYLEECSPVYHHIRGSCEDYLLAISTLANKPISLRAFGPTRDTIQEGRLGIIYDKK